MKHLNIPSTPYHPLLYRCPVFHYIISILYLHLFIPSNDKSMESFSHTRGGVTVRVRVAMEERESDMWWLVPKAPTNFIWTSDSSLHVNVTAL
jgi:hypothetical protein